MPTDVLNISILSEFDDLSKNLDKKYLKSKS